MGSLQAILSTFLVFSLAELGDKSQLVAIGLSSCHRPVLVFLGCAGGMLLVDGVSVFTGSLLGEVLPKNLTNLLSAALFFICGIWLLLSKETRVRDKCERILLGAFLLTVLTELGDKTQVSVIAFSMRFGAVVFIGVVLAILLVVGVSVLLGKVLGSRFQFLRKVSGFVFFALGILLLFSI